MDLVGCRHVEEVEFEGEGWFSEKQAPFPQQITSQFVSFRARNTSDEVVSN